RLEAVHVAVVVGVGVVDVGAEPTLEVVAEAVAVAVGGGVGVLRLHGARRPGRGDRLLAVGVAGGRLVLGRPGAVDGVEDALVDLGDLRLDDVGPGPDRLGLAPADLGVDGVALGLVLASLAGA